jgi:Cap4 SAVED domain
MRFEGKTCVRAVHRADVVRQGATSSLEEYMADRTPYYYKDPAQVATLFEGPYFLSAIRKVLLKLPTAPNFKESHFGEIMAAVYGEEILGLRLLYSKLAGLTSENANAYKMDLLFYRPGVDPAEFIFAEVKSSMKTAAEGLPAGHDKTCFPSLFDSLNRYDDGDLEFDLGAVEERLSGLPPDDQGAIRRALLPHRPRDVGFAGFCVIDRSTHDHGESAVLATRKNKNVFDVDLLCVAELPDVVEETFRRLEALKP